MKPVLFIDRQTLEMDNAHVGAWKPGHELASYLPLYLHPPVPEDHVLVAVGDLKKLHESINGDYYRGEDWEKKCISSMLEASKGANQ